MLEHRIIDKNIKKYLSELCSNHLQFTNYNKENSKNLIGNDRQT